MKNMPTRCVTHTCLSKPYINIIQVIQKIGLCISFYDLLESSDGLIGHGTGLVNVNGKEDALLQHQAHANSLPVKFRMIVFRPFKGEIMLGKIASGTEHGIKGVSGQDSCEP